MRSNLFVATILIISLSMLPGCKVSSERPYASRDGQKITLKPSDMTFEIPSEWIDRYDKYSDNLHLSVDELEAVKEGTGEWDTEYGMVVNSTLPFTRCAAHVGGGGWGHESVSQVHVQARVYILDDALDEVEELIDRQGAAAVVEITGERAVVERDNSGTWRKSILTFERIYDDYQGMAQVEFRLHSCANQTVVFVFMYSGSPFHQATIEGILNSFQCK